MDGSHRYVIIHDNLINPRAVAVYPMKGYIFWTDFGLRSPKIERSFMDGSQRSVIVNESSITQGGRPNRLAIDFERDIIYWTDGKANAIFRMDIDGGRSIFIFVRFVVFVKYVCHKAYHISVVAEGMTFQIVAFSKMITRKQ